MHPSSSTPAAPTATRVSYHRRLMFLVLCLAGVFFFEAGIESGISPSSLPQQRTALNTSTTNVATAQAAAEVTKIAGSVFVAVFTTSASVQSRLVSAGGIVFILGCLVVSAAESVVVLGFGFICLGMGYSFTLILCAPILESYVVLQGERDKIALYLSYAYAGSGLGASICYLVAGLMPEQWRSLYLVGGGILFIFVVGFWYSDKFIASALLTLPDSDRDPRSPPPSKIADNKITTMPLWRLWLHTRIAMQSSIFVWTFASQITMLFYITAYLILLPTFMVDSLHMSSSTAGFIMGASIPATIMGMVGGGWIVKHYTMDLRAQLKFCATTCAMMLPMTVGFFISEVSTPVFIVFLFFGMFFIFMNASPTKTILPLMVDEAGMVQALKEALAIRAKDDPAAVSDVNQDTTVLREVLVAHLNALTNFGCRLMGSVPGPIILASLLDSGMSYPAAFALVGAMGMISSAALAMVAYRKSVIHHVVTPEPTAVDTGDMPETIVSGLRNVDQRLPER